MGQANAVGPTSIQGSIFLVVILHPLRVRSIVMSTSVCVCLSVCHFELDQFAHLHVTLDGEVSWKLDNDL